MFVIANLIFAAAKIVDIVVTLYILALIVHVILSWMPHNPHNSLIQFIYNITEPLLSKIRQLIPPIGGLDLSPVILIFVLYILEGFLVSTLEQLATALK